MQRIRSSLLGLPGVALLGFLALGCGQSEGGRCQVDTDCSSGLECTHGETGNGVCKRPGSGAGQPLPDASPDQRPAAPDVEPDRAAPDNAAPDAAAPDAADAHDTQVNPDQIPGAVEVTSDTDGPDTVMSYDASTSLDHAPVATEVGPDNAAPDAVSQDAAAADDVGPATTTPDAPKSEAGALDTMAID